MRHVILITIIALLVVLIGCEQESPSPTTSPVSTTAEVSDEDLDALRDMVEKEVQPKQSQLPAGHPPIDQMPPADAGTSEKRAQPALTYDAPDTWQRHSVPPRSMRTDQYTLPAVEGDGESGELTVFYFGAAGGGPIEQNIARWRGQFTGPDGQPLGEDASTVEEFESNGIPITYLEVGGTFQPGAMRFGGEAPSPKENYRLLAAIVDAPGGRWFFKAAGPDATMQAHRDAFRALLDSMKIENPE